MMYMTCVLTLVLVLYQFINLSIYLQYAFDILASFHVSQCFCFFEQGLLHWLLYISSVINYFWSRLVDSVLVI